MNQLLVRNIKIIYVIMVLENALFWSAVWILYYLRFTNYAGIGIIESLMITTTVIGEIPTGAVADLLGKKKTLVLAFLLGGIGNVVMGFAPDFNLLLLSVFIMTIGHVLQSGAVEALLYDSLLSVKSHNRYEKVLGNISTIKMITIGFASIIGGFMYAFMPGLPFIVLGLARLIASILCFWLVEPPIDTEKFSLKNYLNQTTYGVRDLFKKSSRGISIIVVGLSAITMINGHMLIDTQVVNQGWSEQALGVITALMFFFSAALAQLTPWLSKTVGKNYATIFTAGLIGISMIVVPWIGMMGATVILMMRNGFLEIFGNTASSIINAHVSSKYRATALSTYNMMANIPYVMSAYLLGHLMDVWSVDTVAMILGILLLVLVIPSVGYLQIRKTNTTYAI